MLGDAQKRPAIRVLLAIAVGAILFAAASGQFGHIKSGTTIIRGGVAQEADAALSSSQATRVVVEDSEWGRTAAEALRVWRATLFGRMAMQYKELERQRSNNGSMSIGRVEPHQLTRYDLFNPFVKCSRGNGSLARLGGADDGGKFICPSEALEQPGCVVYSLGSAGNFDFEEEVLKSTPCEVHSFDCTYDGADLPGYKGRHRYHKICVGQAGSGAAVAGDAVFMTYPAILAMLNHTRVDLLKIDVEGFEMDVFSGWKPACQLPMQIAMEVHYSRLYASDMNPRNFANLFWSLHELSLGELAVFFGHFADLGYAVVSREDNIEWGLHCCAEFTLLKVEQLAGC